MTDELVTRFLETDWGFADSPPRNGAHIHPYPARFIPEIPATALQLLDPAGTIIDPFCGSGTTLMEALRRGNSAVGIDINPIACLISRVKTGRWEPQDESLLLTHVMELRDAAAGGVPEVREMMRASIPRLDHWFDDWAQSLVAGAVSYAQAIPSDDPWRDRVALAISAAMVRISRQESDTRYAAVHKARTPNDSLRELEQCLIRIAVWLRTNSVLSGCSQVICGDARRLSQIQDESISAAIFSPPYPNAYEYWLYHKYRMYWLGFDPIGVRSSEIGARPHYCKPNGLDETDFAVQMSEVFTELGRVLQSSSPVLVVVGDSLIRGKRVDNGELLTTVACETGFKPLASTMRLIRSSSSFNRAHARARSCEHVLLLRRCD